MKLKVEAFDGSLTDKYLDPLPCGGIPIFDQESGYAYRCEACGAVVGSLAMPTDCKDLWETMLEKERIWNRLKGGCKAQLNPKDIWSDPNNSD